MPEAHESVPEHDTLHWPSQITWASHEPSPSQRMSHVEPMLQITFWPHAASPQRTSHGSPAGQMI
jgi:hypothetical protein